MDKQNKEKWSSKLWKFLKRVMSRREDGARPMLTLVVALVVVAILTWFLLWMIPENEHGTLLSETEEQMLAQVVPAFEEMLDEAIEKCPDDEFERRMVTGLLKNYEVTIKSDGIEVTKTEGKEAFHWDEMTGNTNTEYTSAAYWKRALVTLIYLGAAALMLVLYYWADLGVKKLRAKWEAGIVEVNPDGSPKRPSPGKRWRWKRPAPTNPDEVESTDGPDVGMNRNDTENNN